MAIVFTRWLGYALLSLARRAKRLVGNANSVHTAGAAVLHFLRGHRLAWLVFRSVTVVGCTAGLHS